MHLPVLLQPMRLDVVYYYHDMIEEMKKWGYVEGENLFGFGFDFRQSNRYAPQLLQLHVGTSRTLPYTLAGLLTSRADALYIERPAESRCSCSKFALLFAVDPAAARSQPCSV
jgi:hypothetical protein